MKASAGNAGEIKREMDNENELNEDNNGQEINNPSSINEKKQIFNKDKDESLLRISKEYENFMDPHQQNYPPEISEQNDNNYNYPEFVKNYREKKNSIEAPTRRRTIEIVKSGILADEERLHRDREIREELDSLLQQQQQQQFSDASSSVQTILSLESLSGSGVPPSVMSNIYKRKPNVSIFEGIALSTILEDAILQLDILGNSFPGNFIEPEHTDFLTYDERFEAEVDKREFEYVPKLKNFRNPFVIDPTIIGSAEERQASKIQRDRAFVQEILMQAKTEIEGTRTFEGLINNISREDNRRNEEITLLKREKEANGLVKETHEKIKHFEEQTKADEHNRLELINHLRDQLFEAKQQGKQDARYTKEWYFSRNSHNYFDLQNKTELMKMKIKAVEIEMTRDRLAHKNIEQWTHIYCEEIKRNINEWNVKYDMDIAAIDKMIKDTRESIRSQLAFIEGLNKNIEERMTELQPWLLEKQTLLLERAEKLRKFYSVRKIQRWWRAYMVRANLYRGGKKKKKGGKGSKSNENGPEASKKEEKK